MSDDQLQALGLPRREFLKKAAVGVFVAPVIVSFGLGGTAEAAGGCFPNQANPNQNATAIGSIVLTVYNREHQDLIDSDFASQLRKRLLGAEAKLLDGDVKGSCFRLAQVEDDLAHQSGKKINASTASQLDAQVHNVWNNMGCSVCT